MTLHVDNYADIGAYLRDVRENMGISLDTAAAALRIRTRYLDAIEAGDFSLLPGAVYARGYITNYAQWLRLDTAAVLQRYDSHTIVQAQETWRYNARARTVRSMPPGVVVGCCIVMIGVLYFYVGSHSGYVPAEQPELLLPVPPPAAEDTEGNSSVVKDATNPAQECSVTTWDSACFLRLTSQDLYLPLEKTLLQPAGKP